MIHVKQIQDFSPKINSRYIEYLEMQERNLLRFISIIFSIDDVFYHVN